VIHDPRTGAAVADSCEILAYLDTHFPATPPLRAHASRSFVDTLGRRLQAAIFPLLAARNANILFPESRHEWAALRARWLGSQLADLTRTEAQRAELLDALLGVLDEIDSFGARRAGEFLLDNQVSCCDVVVAATLVWMCKVSGEESAEWVAVMTANGGRWRWLMERFAEWEAVDEGMMYAGVSL